MIVRLYLGSAGNIKADGLFIPVDGSICLPGGGGAKVLKESFQPDERMELYGYLENEIKHLRPIPHGQARVIRGEENWNYLYNACQPFNFKYCSRTRKLQERRY